MTDDTQPSISLCMIVKNEESLLGRCLESARRAVDEIVIVDTGSSDRTLDIARRFNARIFEHSWKEDFSAARNVSLAHATSEWILLLDADEILDPRSAESMKGVLSRTTHFGFFFCIMNIKENGLVSGRHFTVRLFRNLAGVRFTGTIHEQVIPMGTRAYAGMTLYHSGYDLKPEIMKRKKERNVRILEQALSLNREDAGVRYHLANTYRLLGDHKQAIAHAVKGMELTESEKQAGSLYITILHVLAEAYVQLKEWDEGEACCLKALEVRDDFIDALYTLSRVYRVKKDYRKSILTGRRFLEKKKLLDSDPERAFFFRSLTSWGREGEIHNNLGGLLYENGNLDGAIEEAKKAIAHSPGMARAHHNLGVALTEKGLLRNAKECFAKALEIQPCYPEAEGALKKIAATDPGNTKVRDNPTAASGKRKPRRSGKGSCKAGISLCMVMRDEGEEAGDFFRLVSPWVDEIIVADTRPAGTGSHPAAAFGATVIRPSWEESFSTIRNISLRHARYEWILVLDADEYMSKDGFFYLKSLITNQNFDGFRFIQRNYRNCPSQSGWVPCTDRVKQAWNSSGWITSHPVKLFKNREEIFFENLIGESVEKAVCRSGGAIGRATILIHHFDQGCDPGKNGTREKGLLKLVEQQCEITPDDPGVRYDLALRYARLKRLDQAAAAFDTLRRELPESFSVCNDLGNVYYEKGEYHKAQHLYQQSSGIEPRFFQAHYNLANLFLVEGDLERSRETYRRALEIFPECGQVYNNLGIICEKRGEDDAAIRNCERAIELNPFLPQAHNNLGTLYAKRGDRLKAEESYLKALGLNLEYTDAYYNLVKLQRENGQEDKVVQMGEETPRCNPGLSKR